ncbi:hypothetical protein NW768_006533 [Fusarium equiseti]|uniref:SGNH hydrolase-type esterase domain-containing protein n=1 Tax=Fusarium equiseti TaxID=61235 RepID=A0ABQ8RBU5_FUSEQ|nr:hypothetical protein NW768_006533 [Fusarium equiseti]
MTHKKLNILCFGDSLTSGYYCYGMGSHPYATKLEDRLSGTFPEVDFDIAVNGVPGDVASFEPWYMRFKEALSKKTYDWVIVLGGTNDIGYGIPTEKIFSSLTKTYDLARGKGSKVLALTVPECGSKYAKATATRNELNKSILNHKKTKFYAFDLKSKIPYHALSRQDCDRYWDDGLHLKEEGYDWMGNHIADAMIDILWHEGTFEQPSDISVVEEEQLAFDEEDGNPRNIDEGYIVVRKKDLD